MIAAMNKARRQALFKTWRNSRSIVSPFFRPRSLLRGAPRVFVDQALELFRLPAGQLFSAMKDVMNFGSDPRRYPPQNGGFAPLKFVLLSGRYDRVLVLKNAPPAQHFQNGIGCGYFPVKLFFAQPHQFAGRNGLVQPDQLANFASPGPVYIGSCDFASSVYQL
jgi:hypothetical protein